MKHVKIPLFLILLLSTVSIICCCNFNNTDLKEAKSESNNTNLTKIVMVDEFTNYAGIQKGWFGYLLAEKLGIELEIIPISFLNDNIKPDCLVLTNSFGTFNPDSDAVDLTSAEGEENLKEFAPYIYENLTEAIDSTGINTYLNSDKKSHKEFFNTWNIRYDLYKKVGKSQINNLDDLTSVFKKIKKLQGKNSAIYLNGFQDPNSYSLLNVAELTKAYYGVELYEDKVIYPKTGKKIDLFAPNSPYVKTLKWYNDLYKNHLLDYTKKSDISKQVNATGNGTAIFELNANYLFDSKNVLSGKSDLYLPVVPKKAIGLTYSDYNMKPNGTVPKGKIYINKNSEKINIVLKLLNYIYSPEGYTELKNGPRGLIWDLDDKNIPYITEEGKKYLNDSTASLPETYCKYNNSTTEYTKYAEGFFQGTLMPYNDNYKIKDYNNEYGNMKKWKSLWENSLHIVEKDYYADNIIDKKALTDEQKEWIKDTGYNDVQEYMDSKKYVLTDEKVSTSKNKTKGKKYIKKAWDIILS